MIDTFLVTATTIHGAGDGAAVDISGSRNRVFLACLTITNVVEQESLDVTVYGSADGTTWGAKPLATFPQKFYRGDHPLLLNLTAHADVKFLRAHWDVYRWGRGSETPAFEFNVTLKEVPPEILKEAEAEAKTVV